MLTKTTNKLKVDPPCYEKESKKVRKQENLKGRKQEIQKEDKKKISKNERIIQMTRVTRERGNQKEKEKTMFLKKSINESSNGMILSE